MKGVSNSAINLIKSVQPYTSGTPTDTVLAVVTEYDNFDKHRVLVVVTTAARIGQNIVIGENSEIARREPAPKSPIIVGFSAPTPRKVTKNGEKVFSILLGEPAPQLEAKADFVIQIAFEKCGLIDVAPVIQALAGLIAGTKHTVELFAGEFK